jgi:hypothetical protein
LRASLLQADAVLAERALQRQHTNYRARAHSASFCATLAMQSGGELQAVRSKAAVALPLDGATRQSSESAVL